MLAIAALVCLALAAQAAPTTENNYVVRTIVAHAPIGDNKVEKAADVGAKVDLYVAGSGSNTTFGALVGTAYTDADGMVLFEGLAPGHYWVVSTLEDLRRAIHRHEAVHRDEDRRRRTLPNDTGPWRTYYMNAPSGGYNMIYADMVFKATGVVSSTCSNHLQLMVRAPTFLGSQSNCIGAAGVAPHWGCCSNQSDCLVNFFDTDATYHCGFPNYPQGVQSVFLEVGQSNTHSLRIGVFFPWSSALNKGSLKDYFYNNYIAFRLFKFCWGPSPPTGTCPLGPGWNIWEMAEGNDSRFNNVLSSGYTFLRLWHAEVAGRDIWDPNNWVSPGLGDSMYTLMKGLDSNYAGARCTGVSITGNQNLVYNENCGERTHSSCGANVQAPECATTTPP